MTRHHHRTTRIQVKNVKNVKNVRFFISELLTCMLGLIFSYICFSLANAPFQLRTILKSLYGRHITIPASSNVTNCNEQASSIVLQLWCKCKTRWMPSTKDNLEDACYKFARGLEPHEHGFFTMFCCPYASTGFELKVTASKKILAKLGQKTHVNSQIFSVSFGFHSIAQMNTKSEHGSQILATWLTSLLLST